MLNLFTFVWGREMTESFLNACLPSMMQPDNIPAASKFIGHYSIYADDEASQRIRESEIYQNLEDVIDIRWFSLQKGRWESTSNFSHQMKISAQEGCYMLLVIPDMVVGNGSIMNMAKLCDGRYNPILFGFPRVNETGWKTIESRFKGGEIVSNRELVSIAMEHIEQTTYGIEDKDTHWLVQHNVPTPCILPDDTIIALWSQNPAKNGGYDHLLPYLIIEHHYPWYLIPDSDIYFQVERGRHFFYEKTLPWNNEKQILSLEFFSKQQAIWKGIKNTAEHKKAGGDIYKLDLFTSIWGKEMTNIYLDVCLPCLLQPSNIPGSKALLHSYSFYASDEARERVLESELYQKLEELLEVKWFPLQKGEWETTSNTLHQMRLSTQEGHYMLIMAPDNIVGDGSILNMARLCDGLHNPILFGFPRINDRGFELAREYLKKGTISNRQLVTLSMRHIEQTTYLIDQKVERWIIHGNIWKVCHNVPTPCILPDDRIIEIFSTNPTLNSGFDHILPYWLVELGYPWYLIRDSDQFFLAERGRHLIIEGSKQDTAVWDSYRQLKGLEFFGVQEAVWRGI